MSTYDLIRSWEDWNAQPGAAHTACALVDQLSAFTVERGGDPVSLRRALESGSREGLAPDVILDKYVEVHAK